MWVRRGPRARPGWARLAVGILGLALVAAAGAGAAAKPPQRRMILLGLAQQGNPAGS